MAEEYDAPRTHECEAPVIREEVAEGVEVTDRGIFGFGKKDEEEKEHEHHHGHRHHHHHHGEGVKEEVVAAEFEEKVSVCEEVKPKGDREEEFKEKHKLGRSGSSSSSSSDEEDEEKKKKRKEKKEKKKKEKEEKEEEKLIEETTVPVEKCGEEVVLPLPQAEEKKGFLEKIKEKIPVVGAKKSEEVAPPPPTSEFEVAAAAAVEADAPPPQCEGGEAAGKEKKGFLEKIKEKIPGYNHKSHEEEKEKKEKEIDASST